MRYISYNDGINDILNQVRNDITIENESLIYLRESTKCLDLFHCLGLFHL